MTEPVPCPVHPAQTAFVECKKCKTPACAYCLDDGPGDVCEACFATDQKRGLIAFERADLGWPARVGRTFRQVLRETGETFSELGDGDLGLGLAWAAMCWALTSVLSFLVISPFVLLMSTGFSTSLPIGAMSAPIFAVLCCGGPLIQALVGITAAFGAAAVFHLTAVVMGGKAGFATALRATSYAQAVVLVWGPLTLAMLLPQLGLIVICLGMIAQLAWGTSILITVARSQYELRGGRAVFAGALPSILAALALATLLTLSWLASEASEPDRSPDRYDEPSGASYYGE